MKASRTTDINAAFRSFGFDLSSSAPAIGGNQDVIIVGLAVMTASLLMLMFTAWGAAGTLGPIIAGRVFDATKSYQYAFYAAAVLALIAFASLLLAKPTVSASETVWMSLFSSRLTASSISSGFHTSP